MTKWNPVEDVLLTKLCAEGKLRFEEMLPYFPTMQKRHQLAGRARRLNIVSTYQRPPKYTYNTAYFETPTLESCYWGGILQTDGCLLRRRDYVTIIWGCSSKDRTHMELFRSQINSTHPIHEALKKCQLSTRDPEKGHLNCRITFEGASQWAHDLKRHFGFDHNKTLRTNPPALPSLTHKLAYIKGLIDGDGCITHSNQTGTICISLCGVNRELLQWTQDVIDTLGLPEPYRRTSNINQATGESCYYLNYSGLRAAVLHEILMRVSTPQLDRKWKAPKALAAKQYWMDRPDIWPPETFFTSLLK